MVVVVRLLVARRAPGPGAKRAFGAAEVAVAAGRLAWLIALIVRPAGFVRLLTRVPAARGGVPTTHLRSIPRRYGRRLPCQRPRSWREREPRQIRQYAVRLHANNDDHGQYAQSRHRAILALTA